LTMTANQPVTVSSLAFSDPAFAYGSPAPSLPARLNAGDTLSVPVTFTPSQTGPVAGQLTATTTDGASVSFSLSGTGQAPQGLLEADPAFLSLGGTEVGGELTGTVTFSNQGAGPLTVSGFDPPSAPFSVSGAPKVNDTIGPGDSVTVDVSFDPQAVGQYGDEITLSATDSQGQNPQSQTVDLSASAATPGQLQFSSEAIDFGAVPVGTTASRTFTISNVGGTAVTIDKSKPPFGGAFAALPPTSLPEGTTIEPGQAVTETVTFAPTSLGSAGGTWQITGDDGSGLHLVQFTGTGVNPSSGSSATGGSPAASEPPPPLPPTSHPSVPAPRAPKLTGSVASTRTVSTTYITYTAMTAGLSRFVLQRVTVGRRGAQGCVAATARNRSRPRCTLYVVIASFAHRDHVGVNKLRLGAFVALRKLGPARYRLRSTLLDTAGAKHTFYSALRIVAPPPLVNSVRWEGLLFRLVSLL
jgi:protein involved in polysaccharide export with SLBB domain